MIKPLTKVDVTRRTIHDALVQNLLSRGWRFKAAMGRVWLVTP